MSDAATGWVPDLRERDGPIYLRIVDALAEARASGALHPGDRLPAQRDLARALAVDLTTVTRAFTEARRRNLVDAAPGRGTFVTPGGAEEPILDLSMNMPPAPAGMNLPALIRAGVEALLKRSSADALLSYHPGPGAPAERAAASLWLERGGERLPPGRIAVGAGAQALLAATVLGMTREGDTILADELTYPGFIAVARSTRRGVAGIAADEHGMRPDLLEQAARQHGSRLLYLNPTLHNPTTLVMPRTRRSDLIDAARRSGLTIIEDDPYSPLLEMPPPSFLMLAPDITIHVATLAKSISPFLRTAFLAAPDTDALDDVAQGLRSISLMAAPLMTGLAAEWIRSGQARHIADAVMREAASRQSIASAILPAATLGAPTGLHAWLPLDAERRASVVVEAARRRGLAVSPAAEFATVPAPPEALRISLGAIADKDKLREALAGLVAVLREPEPRATTLV